MMMSDYIEREAAMEIVTRTTGDYAAAWSEIRRLPAADVAPVVHGRWIEDEYGFNSCSECGYEWDESEYKTLFCPDCGAKMDGGADDADDAFGGF